MSGTKYLLDTNVLSETRRKRPDPKVLAFVAETSGSNLFVSTLTIGELRRGVETKRRANDPVATELEEWVTRLSSDYSGRILPVDDAVASRWGVLTAARPRPVVDTLLAATALVHDLVLVTRNGKDVEGTGVAVFNPWT